MSKMKINERVYQLVAAVVTNVAYLPLVWNAMPAIMHTCFYCEKINIYNQL